MILQFDDALWFREDSADLLSCGYIVPVDKEEKSEAKRGNKRKD